MKKTVVAVTLIEPGRDEALEAAGMMRTYGGHFAQYIGAAYIHADGSNQRKLLDAFQDLFQANAKRNW